MQITKDKVVTFHYSLSELDGPEVESNNNSHPMAYLHGHKNILPGLEEAMEGKSTNDEFEVTLAPDQAYGPVREGAIQKVPVKHLVSKHKRLLPGTLVKVNTDQGPRDASVVKAGKFMVTLDMNHPFAGKTLVFNITIKEIRDASAEEIAHGHAHGVGGHQH